MGLFLKDWSEKASVGWGQGERGGEILCRDLNGVKGSGEECLGRGNSKLKEAFDDGGSRHDRGPGRQPVWLALSCGVVIGRKSGME